MVREQAAYDKWDVRALAAATLILILPLWLVSAPALPDYPAHLASFYLIGGGVHDPVLARFYHLEWSFVPYLASEITVPWLAKLVGLEVAAKLFLSAALALWVVGPGLIHRALYGRIGIAPLGGAFFAYNANFLWGFLNYYFAAGLCFVIFAAWLQTRDRRNGAMLALFAVAVTVLYFCHIFAAATLLLLIAGLELAAYRRDLRTLALRAAQVAAIYLPAALAFLFLRPAGGGGPQLQFNLVDTMRGRFESIIEYHFDDPAYGLPVLLLVVLLAALVTRRARLHPALWLSLTALLLATLFAPEWAMGGWAVHLRLPAFFAAMLYASTEFRFTLRSKRAIAGGALAFLVWNAAALTANWHLYDRQFKEFRAASKDLPRGQRLLTVLDGDAIGMASDQPYWHMAEFAIIDRSDFTPLMFTTKGQHVVQLNPPYQRIAAATAQQGSPPDIDELDDLAAGRMEDDEDYRSVLPYLQQFQCHYDEAVVIHLGGKRSTVPHMLRLRHAGSFFTLYDVKPDGACKP